MDVKSSRLTANFREFRVISPVEAQGDSWGLGYAARDASSGVILAGQGQVHRTTCALPGNGSKRDGPAEAPNDAMDNG